MQDNLFERIETFVNDPDNQESESKLLTKEEVDKLIDIYIENHEEFTEEEIYQAVGWAEDAVLRYNLLQLVLKGFLKMTCTGDPDDFVFSRIDI